MLAVYFSIAFLVGAFINKRARLLQSLVVFSRQTRSDELDCLGEFSPWVNHKITTIFDSRSYDSNDDYKF